MVNIASVVAVTALGIETSLQEAPSGCSGCTVGTLEAVVSCLDDLSTHLHETGTKRCAVYFSALSPPSTTTCMSNDDSTTVAGFDLDYYTSLANLEALMLTSKEAFNEQCLFNKPKIEVSRSTEGAGSAPCTGNHEDVTDYFTVDAQPYLLEDGSSVIVMRPTADFSDSTFKHFQLSLSLCPYSSTWKLVKKFSDRRVEVVTDATTAALMWLPIALFVASAL